MFFISSCFVLLENNFRSFDVLEVTSVLGQLEFFFLSFISGPAKHFTKLSLVGARNKTISKMLQDNNRSRIRKMSSEGHNGDCCSATVSRRAQLHVLLRNCALRNRAQLLQHFPLHRQRRSS